LASLFIQSKLTPLIVLVALGLGAIAIVLTPREEEPQIVVPMVDIMIGLPGSSPQEVESRITVPLERRLWQIPGVEYLYSSSMPEAALLTVRFEVGEDFETSLIKVYDKLAAGLDQSPPGATLPLIKVRSIDDVPVLALTLSSERYDSYQLRRMAGELRQRLTALDDVADVTIIGGSRRTLRVELEPQALAAANLDASRIADLLRAQNSAVTAGSFASGNRQILVETGALISSKEDFESLVVGVADRKPIYLTQVARIIDGPDEATSIVLKRNGAGHESGASQLEQAVTLQLAKRKGSDAYRVSESALRTVEELRTSLIPGDVSVTITRNYGETANEKATELLEHLILAIISVSILIGLALGWRGALVVFISVPVSFALTLFVYYVFGYTLNRVTLFALIFVTGIVVDDSIIVVENIVRHLARHKSAGGKTDLPTLERAAILAVNEVGNPTILATLTVIASVLPMAFVRGLMGPYMEPMPTGASLAMGFSLFVALIVAPWFAYRLLRPSGGDQAGHEALEHETVDKSSRTYRIYERLLIPMLERPRRAFTMLGLVTLALMAALALVPLGLVNVKMLPFDNKSEFQVIIDMPEGTTLESTANVARDLSDVLAQAPEVHDIELYAGAAAPIGFSGLVRHYDLRAGDNVADLQVNLKHKKQRDSQSHAIAKRLRQPLQEVARRHGAAIKVVEVPPGPPVLATLVAEIYGPTAEQRRATAEQVREIFRTSPDVVDLDWTLEAAQPKLSLAVDREKAALAGIQPAQVTRTLRLALEGETTGLLHIGPEEETLPIRVRFPRAARSSTSDLTAIRIQAPSGALIPVSELATVENTTREPSRMRKNLRPVVYVMAEVAGTSESPVYAILGMRDKIDQLAIEQHFRDEPKSVEQTAMKWDGEWHITYEVFRDLGAAFGMVLILIYVLLIGWFGSFRTPLVMMVAIPLGLVGVLPGHFLYGAFFTATSMIGFIALAGIMVRNSVLLIDFVHQAQAGGASLHEAVVAAGAIRLRPILLTAGTVVVGAVVILFDPIFQGLAIALMFGALASTALTLVVVPVLHFLIESRFERT
jgi:multidrug efflux pump subunit AcrB